MIKSLKELKNELKFFKKLLKIYNKYKGKVGFLLGDKIEEVKKKDRIFRVCNKKLWAYNILFVL